MLVCEELYTFFETLMIDDQRKHTLTKYATTKGVKTKVISDHNPMFAKFAMNYEKSRQSAPRRKIFNLKNKECQQSFYETTSHGEKLQSCFQSNNSFENQSNKFFKSLDDTLHKCFKKIRVRKSGQKVSGHASDVQTLIKQKTKLSSSLSNTTCRLGRQITENVIQEIEDDICSKSADRNAEIVKEYVQSMTNGTGNFSQLSMWKLKNELCPNSADPPMAKRDKYGTLISAPSLLKKLYLDTYTERLRNREIRPEITDLYEMKCELWKLQFEALKTRKSRPWEVSDLDKVLKKLKNNKTRDPQGLINEIFKPGVIGMDLK